LFHGDATADFWRSSVKLICRFQHTVLPSPSALELFYQECGFACRVIRTGIAGRRRSRNVFAYFKMLLMLPARSNDSAICENDFYVLVLVAVTARKNLKQ
jgi:hypothetical protein